MIVGCTFPRIPKICQGFSHDDGSVDSSIGSIGTIQAKLNEYRVQYAFHDIPVAHYAAPRFKGIPDLTSCCSIRVCIVADIGDSPIQLAVSVPSYVGWEG